MFVGWVATRMMNAPGRTVLFENVAVSLFGAFIGGDAVHTLLNGTPKDATFSLAALGLAAGCAVAMLLLLRLMRGAVGPLRSGKSKARR